MTRAALVAAAADSLSASGADGSSLCAPLVVALPVEGASVSTLGDPFESENVCASDAASARVTQAQLDLGQGPIWTALLGHVPVTTGDLADRTGRWPLFADATRAEEVQAIHALPLSVGTLDVGAVALYSEARGVLAGDDMAGAEKLARIVASQVLRRALDALGEESGTSQARWSTRREVHQATGMLIAHLSLTPDDALTLLRGHAFVLGIPVLEVAEGILDRRILIDTLTDDDDER